MVGESGSGKSTLAQLMCGLLVPSSGEVLFEGKTFPSAGASKSRYCDLNTADSSGWQGSNGPSLYGISNHCRANSQFQKTQQKEEEREINDLLTMMELPEEIKLRKAHELSGGQQKRVCIARALAAQPDVLILMKQSVGWMSWFVNIFLIC